MKRSSCSGGGEESDSLTVRDDETDKKAKLPKYEKQNNHNTATTSTNPTADTLIKYFNSLDKTKQIACIGGLSKQYASTRGDMRLRSGLCRALKNKLKIDFLKDTPDVVAKLILSYLSPKTLALCSMVSKTWCEASNDGCLWKRICVQHINRKCTVCGAGSTMSCSLQQFDDIKKVSALQDKEGGEGWRYDAECSAEDKAAKWKCYYQMSVRLDHNWRKGRYKTTILTGHEQSVLCLQLHHDVVLTGSKDGTIKEWKLDNMDCVKTYKCGSPVQCLQFDHNKVIAGLGNGHIRIISRETGHLVREFLAHKGPIKSLQYTNSFLVTSEELGLIKGWCFSSGHCKSFYGHTNSVNCVRIHNNCLISVSDDMSLRIWHLRTGQCWRTLLGHQDKVLCGQLVSKNRAISCGADNNIKIFDYVAGEVNTTLYGHTNAVTCVQSDNIRIVSGSHDKTLRIWDLDSGKLFQQIDIGSKVNALNFDSQCIAVGDECGKLHIIRFDFDKDPM